MISSLSFLFEDVFRTVLWKGYNPIRSYVSQLTANGAPNIPLTRTLFYIDQISLIIFLISLLVKSFQNYGICLKTGYTGLTLICF